MRLLKNHFLRKTPLTRHFKGELLLSALIVLALAHLSQSEPRSRVPARVLAKQTGATQFEEERYETHSDCNDHKHHLKKRASDEDVDYEVYQGVVGRPGIDFPIYPRIPKTSFSCRSYGNGYFADMETDCQVFHICEEGRKISFLCPNGTIFQQSELTCDWWFKVNCLGSSGYYADSAELLNKQRVQRLRPAVPVQGFNIVGGGLNIKPRTPAKATERSRAGGKSERRIDSDENPSLENVDFDDLSGEKQIKGGNKKSEITNIDDNENESQITAETSSFVANRNRNTYLYDKPKVDDIAGKTLSLKPDDYRKSNGERNTQRINYNESTEKARLGQRGNQRYREDKQPEVVERMDRLKPALKKEKIIESYERVPNSTPTYLSGTYTTARRLDSTRSTPFYTPTVPTVSKARVTEGKGFYIKTGNAATPSPNRVSVNNAGSGLFLENSSVLRTSPQSNDFDITAPTTLRPFIIGMRHYYDGGEDASFEFQKTRLNSEDLFVGSTTPATAGPTYLPKSNAAPKASLTEDAGGDNFLFAPIPTVQDEVSRNVNDMLKTVNMLKHNFEDVEIIKFNGKSRAGLDIPPSSGPDALVSLAQYFATEQNQSNINSLNANDDAKGKGKISGTVASVNSKAPKQKPSDTTATLTTAATPKLSKNSENIKTSLLTNTTVVKYNSLFGLNGRNATARELARGLVGLAGNETKAQRDNKTPFPQIGTTDSTIRELAEKPESRKIAQVFSNALNNYLQDPATFRENLVTARPTQPPTTASETTTRFVNTQYTATKSTPRAHTTTEGSIAGEINFNFATSTIIPDSSGSTTEVFDATTFRSSSEQKHSLELSAELEPPTPESGEGEEFLQGQHSQSFAKQRNQVPTNTEKFGKITTTRPTENPWSLISDGDYLDPLKINDGLMKKSQQKTTTVSPFTYLPKDTTTQLPSERKRGNSQVLSSSRQRAQQGKQPISSEQLETRHNSRYRIESEPADPWQEIFDNYDIPRDSLPSNSGLQRIANKLFGGLTETEALHLKHVMAQAEHNRQVLRLLLLLIQTCDDQNGKALERSRKHLLNALIDMDAKLENKKAGRNSKITTTEKLPVTTYRRTGSGEEFTTSTLQYPSTTTDFPSTTLYGGRTTTDASGSGEFTTKFEIIVAEPEKDGFQSSAAGSSASGLTENNDASSDKRALELLKSLYSLASKFSSRR